MVNLCLAPGHVGAFYLLQNRCNCVCRLYNGAIEIAVC